MGWYGSNLSSVAIHADLTGMERLLQRNRVLGILLVLLVTVCSSANRACAGVAEQLDASGQVILCLAPTVTSSEGSLQRYSRGADGQWHSVGGAWPVLFGRKGLAWGQGLQPSMPGDVKLKNDGKSPLGVFKIGTVLGYGTALPSGNHGWPYHQVTDRDAWMDDETIIDFSYATDGDPYGKYNHLYTLKPGQPKPDWWSKEQMHLGDFAYTWLVLIEHNYDHPNPAYGNEIFFHIRRGEHYRTAGCTTMEQSRLETLVSWLKPEGHPLLVQLTTADYQKYRSAWHLP